MNLQQELIILKQQLQTERAARRRAEQLLEESRKMKIEGSCLAGESVGIAEGPEEDLSEADEAGKKILDEHFFMEEVLNKTPAGIIVVDAQYRYLFANPMAISDPALREWMIGKTNEEFCRYTGGGEAKAKARREIFEKVLLSKQLIEWEEKNENAQGEVEYFLCKVYPALDELGEVRWVIVYGVNITERRKFEEKVRFSEKRYRDLFSYSQALICTHDMEGTLLTINPEVSKTLGYSEEEMLGRKIQAFIPEDNQAQFETDYLSAIRNNNNIVNGVFCILSKDGQRIYLLYKNYRVEESGLEPYVIGFAQNVTDRIEVEKELRFAKQISEEGARAKETFLAHMSHEIRTPMNGILGIAGLLAKTKLDDQQRNYLQLIQESANNLLVIVNDILDLEKIIAGKLNLERIGFKIVNKIATTIQSFIYKTEEKELGLIFRNFIPADLVVTGDPYRLSQVLNNILSNALKFTESGHIDISTGVSEKKEGSVTIEITVKDTGIGISEERIKKVFEPFVQADATISRKYGGTGLGLTICKHLIEMQQGELFVQSEEGKGSAFTVRIPYHISTEEMENETIQDNQENKEINYKSLGRKRVLVAEDVELNQYLAKHILESWDFEVVIANNGKEALDHLQQASFDCILMDVQMPEMDGIEATQHIRLLPDPVKSSIPIIALTANALKGDSEKYISAGMNDYLAKPFDEVKLFMVISRNLRNGDSMVTAPDKSKNGSSINKKTDTNMFIAEGKLYDLTMVKSVSGGDEGFIKKMVALFIETVPQNVQELNKGLQSENWEQVGKMAHKLKSTVDSMGIQSIRQDIRTVEANAKQQEFLDQIPPLVQKIERVINHCIEQLQVEIL